MTKPAHAPRTAAAPSTRVDAQRNRAHLIEAARELLARDGLDVSVAQIAERAGVGKGTVFRHFETKGDLVAEVVTDVLERLLSRGRALIPARSADAALRDFMEQAVSLQANDQAFCEVVAGAAGHDDRVARAVARLHELVDELTRRAIEEGAVRSDVTGRDIALLLSGIYQTAAPLAASEPDLWRRYLVIALDGLSPQRASVLPGRALR